MICAEPIVCYEFKKNAREVVRATCQEFAGLPVVDLRSFMPKADGSLAPTPRGLTLQRSQLPELEAAVLALRFVTHDAPSDESSKIEGFRPV